MSVGRDVIVTVIKEIASLSRPGFGSLLIAGYHTVFPNRVREYFSLEELVDDGFALTHPIYLAASRALSQSPRVRSFKVGRLSPATQVIDIGVAEARSGVMYNVRINEVVHLYTADTATSVQEVVEGLAALINAGSQPMTATEDDTKLTLTADVAGAVNTVEIYDSVSENLLTMTDATADRSIADDLSAIEEEDGSWYGLILADAFGAAEIEEVADWVEARKHLCVCVSADTGCTDAGVTSDIMSTLKTAAYERTTVVYHNEPLSFPNAAIMSRQFALDPGSSNAAHKTLAGVPAVALKGAQMEAIENKNGNHYTEAGGSGRFRYGVMPSGEWFDIMHGTDWFESEVQFDVYALLAANEKIDYDQAGADMVGATIEAAAGRAVRARLFKSDPAPEVTVPDVSDPTQVSDQNKADRLLPGVEVRAYYRGAVNRASITIRTAL